MGEAHLHAFLEDPRCEVVSLCDFSDEKRQSAKDKYANLHWVEDSNTVLEDPEINVVSIASYDNYHHEQVIKAITHDKHVFVEKPLCLSKEEAADIQVHLQEKPNLKLSCNLILRKSPRFQWLRETIRKGTLGEPFYLEGDYNYGRVEKVTQGWRGKIDFYSVVYGGAVHIVDLMLWLTGGRVVEVAAYGNRIATRGTQFKYNDMVASIMRFESGMVAKVTSNYACVYPHHHNLTVYGTKATFVNDIKGAWLFESRDLKQAPQEIDKPYPDVRKGDLIQNFIEWILNGAEPIVSTGDVFKTMSVCFAIQEALETGKPVRVPSL